MTSITSFADAEAVLATYVPQQLKNTGKHYRLERMQPLLDAIGNPQEKLRIVHIAGTSGKTSTTYYVTALLAAAGKKVGTTVSPHVDSITERVQINGQPISETEFYTNFDEFMQLIKGVDMAPTYFELIIAFAYWYFVKVQVDYTVVETGLGGLLDATNVAQNTDKICVITDIGYDHMNILGATLPEIAAQKAGIIHAGNQVFIHRQADEIMQVFATHCDKFGAELHILDQKTDSFQERNWILANEIYTYIKKCDMLPELTDTELQKTRQTAVPGRMDIRRINGKTLIMDGAHNGQKMAAFVVGFRHDYPGQKAAVLLSLKAGKEFADVLPLLAQIADELIITSFNLMQDTPLHSMELDELAAQAQKYIKKVSVLHDQNQAYLQLLQSQHATLIITGSFYLIGQLRKNHKELQVARD